MKKYLYRNFIVIVFQNGKVAFQPNSFNCSVADSVTEAKKEIDLFWEIYHACFNEKKK